MWKKAETHKIASSVQIIDVLWYPWTMDKHGRMDKLIDRARVLLGFMPGADVAETFAEAGIDKGDTFLAIKAAQILNEKEGE